MLGTCIISGKETCYNFHGTPIDKDVMEFAKKYRDALGLKNARGVLIAFSEMKNRFGHTWETIQSKLIDELKEKGITLEK